MCIYIRSPPLLDHIPLSAGIETIIITLGTGALALLTVLNPGPWTLNPAS